MKRPVALLVMLLASASLLAAVAGAAAASVIDGVVRDFSGAPIAGADVMWATEDWVSGNYMKTDAAGAYLFKQVPALAGTGQLWVTTPGRYDPLYMRDGVTFLAPGPNTFNWWPGRLAASVTRGGPFQDWSGGSVSLYGSDARSALSTDQRIHLARTVATWSGSAYGLPGEYTSAAFTFRGGGVPVRRTEAQQIEFPAGAPAIVESAQTGSVTLAFDETKAGRFELGRWASGARGSLAVLRFANFPAGYVLHVTGQSLNGRDSERDFGTVTIPSPAPPVFAVSERVPKGIPVADFYTFTARPEGGGVDFSASFETSRLTASHGVIRAGSPVRLTGRVPVALDPHDPIAPDARITVFSRSSAAGQPAGWSAGGWTKVATIRRESGALGAQWFKTPPLHPGRTTWYVVRYPWSGGHDTGSYWRGFTSVVKVVVRQARRW